MAAALETQHSPELSINISFGVNLRLDKAVQLQSPIYMWFRKLRLDLFLSGRWGD